MGTQAGKAKQSKAGQDTTGQDREKGHYHTSKPAWGGGRFGFAVCTALTRPVGKGKGKGIGQGGI